MSQEIDKTTRRVFRYWYSDGFTELTMGGLFVLVGVLLYALATTPSGSPIIVVLSIGIPGLVLGGGYLARRILGSLKERVTYPRTGYVAYRTKEGDRGRWIVIASVLVLGLLLAFAPVWVSQIPLVEGVIMCTIFVYLGFRFGVIRFYLLAICTAVISMAASVVIGISDELGSAVVFGAVGLVMMVSGGITLWVYLRRTQPPEKEV